MDRRIVSWAVLVAMGAMSLSSSPSARSETPVDVIGTIFGEMIRKDMQVRRQREGEAILVRRMQAALQRLGYYEGVIDGDFGAGTRGALAAYRRDRNIPLSSAITEYDIADIEAQARSRPAAAGQSVPELEEAEEFDEPAVEYTAATPEEAWTDDRFSEFNAPLKGALTPPDGAGWLLVASAISFDNVIGAALKYAKDFPGTMIVKSGNGRFAIVIGWLSKPEARKILAILKESNTIPQDSFMSSGQKFFGPAWTTASAGLKSRNDLLRYGFFRASAHLWDRVLNAPTAGEFGQYRYRVSGVASSDGTLGYLSLRKAGAVSAGEITQMPEGSLLRVIETSSDWSRVKLLDGREGWANAKYLAFNADVLNGHTAALKAPHIETPNTSPFGDKDLQDRLVAEGSTLLQDARRFLATQQNIDNIAAIAEAAGRLNTALGAKEFAGIESATATLNQLLTGNAAFRQFAQDRQRERERAERFAAEQAIKKSAENSYFLKTYIARNITAPEVAPLAALLKEIEATGQTATSAALTDINERIDATVVQYDIVGQRAEILRSYTPTATASTANGNSQSESSQEPQDQDSPQKQEELKRIATEGEALLAQLQRYATTGKQALDALQTAQLAVNLEASLKSKEGVAILRDYKALSDLLARDAGFTTFKAQEDDATKLASARKREAANNEAKRLIAFTESYIRSNYTSDKVATLLEISKVLQETVIKDEGGNSKTATAGGPELFASVDTAHLRLKGLNLDKEMSDFRLANPADERLSLVNCRAAIQQSQWDAAVALCKTAFDEGDSNPEIASLLKLATEGVARKQIGDEQRKLESEKLEAARTAAETLMAELSAYNANNGALTDAITVARHASALRKASEGNDAAALAAATRALTATLGKDKYYQEFLAAKKQEDGDLNRDLLKAQATEARRLRGFIAAFVSRNVTAPEVETLLEADDLLVKALDSATPQVLRQTVDQATAAIVKVRLGEELSSFVLNVEQPAEIKVCLDLAGAQDWGKADAACQSALERHPDDGLLLAARKAIDVALAERRKREELERIEVARQRATDTLARIELFAGSGQKFRDPEVMIGLIADLRRSLSGNDGSALLRALDHVTVALQENTGFADFLKSEQVQRQRNELDALAGARSESNRIKVFVETILEKNIATPDAPTLIDASKVLIAAAEGSSISAINNANKNTTALLTRLGLGEELLDFSLAPANPPDAPAASQNNIVLNDRNRVLLEGDDGDILLFFNNSGKAPNVRRDLVGRLDFGKTVALCWYHPLPEPDLATRLVYRALVNNGAAEIDVTGVCKVEDLDTADIVAVRRKDFMITDRQYAKPLVDRIETGAIVAVATVTAAEIQKRQQQDEKSVSETVADIKAGRRKGFGVVATGKGGDALCLVAGASPAALRRILEPELKPLTGQLSGLQIRPTASADIAFAGLRSSDCAGAILTAEDLMKFVAAAEREKVTYRLLPWWIRDSDVVAAQQFIDAERAALLRAEEAHKREIEDARKQEEIRQKNLGETKHKDEAAMRERYGASAHGLAVDLGDVVKAFINAPNAADVKTSSDLFPRFSQWHREQIIAGWELESDGYDYSLLDYGAAQWQSRDIEVIFIQALVRMKHRDLGKYQSLCFVLGAIVDGEFNRYRDAFEAPCDAAMPDVANWKSARHFESRWIKL